MEIDPRFKAARAESRRRRRNSWLVPLILWVGGASVLGGLGTGLYFGGVLTFGHPTAREVAENQGVQDEGVMQESAAAYNSAFVDLAGDPMILRFDTTGAEERRKTLPRPAEIPAERAGGDLVLLSDDMITTEERLITTLPSSREDFAFFQAQREASASAPVLPIGQPTPVAEPVAEDAPPPEAVAAPVAP